MEEIVEEIVVSTSNLVWQNAFAATAAISFIPNVILFAIPTRVLTKGIDNKIHFQHILLCFASGALLGTYQFDSSTVSQTQS